MMVARGGLSTWSATYEVMGRKFYLGWLRGEDVLDLKCYLLRPETKWF